MWAPLVGRPANNQLITVGINRTCLKHACQMCNKFFVHNILFALLVSALAAGCKEHGPSAEEDKSLMFDEPKIEIKGDSMIYGLSCDGSSDSVIVLWPFDGEPVTYSCIDAKRAGRVIGHPQIGDWVGVMVDPADTAEATFVINLDQLKGTWTYTVFPVMKDLQSMSRRMQKRMMENMPDSIRQTYFVPREYGFTLKRHNEAQAVGRIMRTTTLEEDSPVQYPEVKRYRKWYTLNGKLILASSSQMMRMDNTDQAPKVSLDTLEFLYMDNDSLILSQHGRRMGFHRKKNAMSANAEATKAQQRQDEKKVNIKLK